MEDSKRQANSKDETNKSSWGSASTRSHALPWSRRAEVVATPEFDEGQLSKDVVLELKKGDIVYVLQEDSSGWWGCHKEGTEETGWFPASALKPASDSSDAREYDGGENSRGFDFPGPLTTSDHRAVASPQASCRHGGQVKQATESYYKPRHEAAEAERLKREKEEFKHRVSVLEAENRRLLDERDAERRDCEKLGKEKERLEQRLMQIKENAERDVANAREQLQTKSAELARSHDELARKEARVNQLEREPALRDFATVSVLQANARNVSSLRAEVDDRRMVESSLLSDGGHGTPHGSGSREDALIKRVAASSVSRQLFTQPVADETPPNSARGIARTNSAPLHGILATGHAHQLPGQLPGPTLVAVAPSRPAPSPRSNVPQQRSLHSTPQQPCRSQSHGAAPLISSAVSPRNHIGKVSKQATTATVQQPAGDTRPLVQVRAIVSEIERRATSQTPGPMTSVVDTTPGVQRSTPLVVGSASRTTSASASGCARSLLATVNATTVAKAESTRGRWIGDHDCGHGSSPHPSEDRKTWSTHESVAQSQLTLGLSPMGRPQKERGVPVTTKPVRAAMGPSLAASSPTPKGLTINERMQRLRNAGIQP